MCVACPILREVAAGRSRFLHPISNQVHQQGHYMARLRGVSMACGETVSPYLEQVPCACQAITLNLEGPLAYNNR